MTTVYIHTLDGRPAMFDGYQVCYAAHYGRANDVALSLRQIRREQAASTRNRLADGLSDDLEYGYRRYAVDLRARP